MGTLRFVLLGLVVMVPALGPACGSSDKKVASRGEAGVGGASDA